MTDAPDARRRGTSPAASNEVGALPVVNVEVQRASEATGLPDKKAICRCIEAAVAAAGRVAGRSRLAMVVRVVDEQESRELNGRYRGKNRSTNVLAFAAEPGGLHGLPATGAEELGDLVICAPVVEREAREQGKSADAHWKHMLVHGTLHLLGFDHETAAEARTMERLEIGILAGFGIEDPYSVR